LAQDSTRNRTDIAGGDAVFYKDNYYEGGGGRSMDLHDHWSLDCEPSTDPGSDSLFLDRRHNVRGNLQKVQKDDRLNPPLTEKELMVNATEGMETSLGKILQFERMQKITLDGHAPSEKMSFLSFLFHL
jgi:hypothetical protein